MHEKQRTIPVLAPLLLPVFLLILSGNLACASYSHLTMQMVPPAEQPYFFDTATKPSLQQAVQQSLAYLKKLPAHRSFQFGKKVYDRQWMEYSLRYFLYLLDKSENSVELHSLIRKNFDVYQASGQEGQDDILVTGYYEPLLEGSLQKKFPYLYPLYARPADLLGGKAGSGEVQFGRLEKGRLVPYWTRKEIEESEVLAGNELVYLKDPVDAFILHVQGSGRILLPDGSIRHIQYAAKNGRPYKSIGRHLIDKGMLAPEEASLPGIRCYLENNKAQCREILQHNPSYIFFQWADKAEGAKGCLGKPLTPLRSVALDQALFPAGALGFLESWQPTVDQQGRVLSWQPMSLFVLNQDSGSAIKGPSRVDFFWGTGRFAEAAAGNMKHKGKLYFLVKKR